jgi:regulatory protein
MAAHQRKSKLSLRPEALERAALSYLERYASSAENLRRVLHRRVTRAERQGPVDREATYRAIDVLLAKLRRLAVLDDARHAGARAEALFRQGKSISRIAATLAAQGIAGEVISAALEALKADHPEPDRAAATAYARRRRLGPWRQGPDREAYRNRDMAALARRGFSLATVRAVIDAENKTEEA